MNLDKSQISELAGRLLKAKMAAFAIPMLSDLYPALGLADAYAIQDELRHRKLAQGRRLVGLKMGLTSRAKMQQVGVSAPICGFLADDDACADGADIAVKELIHPRVEAEIAFVTRAVLRGPGCHIGAVLAATDFVAPALEVIDSRYRDFRFDLPSVVADNTSAARFAIGGTARSAGTLDLKTLGVVLEKNGEVAAVAAGAAVLGHPAASVAMLANLLAARGEQIAAGAIVLTGGMTEAIAVKAGDHVTARFQDLGSVSLSFV
jgi:2-oxo-3-hexenedioate decarboxylase